MSGSKCSASSAAPQVAVSGSTSKALPASDVLVNLKKPVSKQKSATKPSSSGPLNHKTFRLRIKVGSSDLSSPKNVSTYNSKQGFNIPPSTSEGEEGLLNRIQDSPTKILMVKYFFYLFLFLCSLHECLKNDEEEFCLCVGYGVVPFA